MCLLLSIIHVFIRKVIHWRKGEQSHVISNLIDGAQRTSALFRLVCAMTMSAAYRSHSCSHRLDCSGAPRGTMAQVLPTKRLVAMETFASTWDNLFAAAVCRELLWRKTFAAVGKECGAASDGAQHHQRPRILISLRLLIGATITRKNGAAQSRAA